MKRDCPARGDYTQITVFSLIASLVLVLLCLGIFSLAGWLAIDLSQSMGLVITQVKSLPAKLALQFFGAMMVAAAVWGVLTGVLSHLSIGTLLYNAKLSPVAPEDNVFTQAIAERFSTSENLIKRRTDTMEVPWLRIRDETGETFGRLQQANLRIEPDDAFEVYLSPCHHQPAQGQPWQDLPLQGVYRHVLPTSTVEVYAALETWSPPHANAQQDAADD